MYNINEMLKFIDEYQSPINKEIKNDDDALKVWQMMNDLEQKLLDIKEAQRLKTTTTGGKMRQQIDKKSLYYEHQGSNTIYYSYNTTVAVKTPIDTYVSENVWSITTAKHLNRIEELTGSNKEYRMRYKDFREFCINNNVNKHYN